MTRVSSSLKGSIKDGWISFFWQWLFFNLSYGKLPLATLKRSLRTSTCILTSGTGFSYLNICGCWYLSCSRSSSLASSWSGIAQVFPESINLSVSNILAFLKCPGIMSGQGHWLPRSEISPSAHVCLDAENKVSRFQSVSCPWFSWAWLRWN